MGGILEPDAGSIHSDCDYTAAQILKCTRSRCRVLRSEFVRSMIPTRNVRQRHAERHRSRCRGKLTRSEDLLSQRAESEIALQTGVSFCSGAAARLFAADRSFKIGGVNPSRLDLRTAARILLHSCSFLRKPMEFLNSKRIFQDSNFGLFNAGR